MLPRLSLLALLLLLGGPAHAGKPAEAVVQAEREAEAFFDQSRAILEELDRRAPEPDRLSELADAYAQALRTIAPLLDADDPSLRQAGHSALAELDRRLGDTLSAVARAAGPELRPDELASQAARAYRRASDAYRQAAVEAFDRGKKRDGRSHSRASFETKVAARGLEGDVPTPEPLPATQLTVVPTVTEQLAQADAWIALALRDCKTYDASQQATLTELQTEIRAVVAEEPLRQPALLVRTLATLEDHRCPRPTP